MRTMNSWQSALQPWICFFATMPTVTAGYFSFSFMFECQQFKSNYHQFQKEPNDKSQHHRSVCLWPVFYPAFLSVLSPLSSCYGPYMQLAQCTSWCSLFTFVFGVPSGALRRGAVMCCGLPLCSASLRSTMVAGVAPK